MYGYKAADGSGEVEYFEREGQFSHEGAEEYFSSRNEAVHADNFTELYDGRKISKIAIGTQGRIPDIQGDFRQYIALK